jgi:enoyl-CoA hydratase/carnithine racemase
MHAKTMLSGAGLGMNRQFWGYAARGVLPELNSPFTIPRIVGLHRGLQLLLTGEIITGAKAAEIGLVSEAVPKDEVLPRALEIARDIATNVAPVSAAILKRLVYLGTEQTDPAAAQRNNHRIFGWVARQPDAMEGPMSFMEKRDPDWKLKKNSDFPSELFEGDA